MKRVDNLGSEESTHSGWPLYVCFSLTLGLLWLERHAALSPADHTVALITIVLAFFALTIIWLRKEGGI